MPWPIRFGPAPRITTRGRAAGRDLRLLLVGRVVVRRPRGELPAARVDRLEDRHDAERLAPARGRPTSVDPVARAIRASESPARFACEERARVRVPRGTVPRKDPGAPRHLRDLVDEPRVDRRTPRRPRPRCGRRRAPARSDGSRPSRRRRGGRRALAHRRSTYAAPRSEPGLLEPAPCLARAPP